MLPATFPRQARLLTSRQFNTVFSDNNCRVAHPNLLLLANPNSLDHPRLGLIVAKKHVRTAVKRNRIKRVVRESFRQSQHELGGVDVIFLARPGITALSRSEQTQLLQQSWRKLADRLSKLAVAQS